MRNFGVWKHIALICMIAVAVIGASCYSMGGRDSYLAEAPEGESWNYEDEYVGDRSASSGSSGYIGMGHSEQMPMAPPAPEASRGAGVQAAGENEVSPLMIPTNGSDNMVSRALATAGIDEGKLDSWLMPKAYAADHGSDERYLVRNGECRMDVPDYKAATIKITTIAESYNGMVTDSQSQRFAENHIEGWLTIRVPAENFTDAWDEVLAVGDVASESVSSDDVSNQYLGYISHLKILTAEQATLENMLDEALKVQRTRGLGEGYGMLLDIQSRLFDITEEIESTEDRAGALADRITRSTITVHLTELKEISEQVEDIKEEWDWGFGQTGVDAWKNLRAKGRSFGQGFVWFFVTGWTGLIPWVIIYFVGLWIYRRWIRPKLARKKSAIVTDETDDDADNADGDTGS